MLLFSAVLIIFILGGIEIDLFISSFPELIKVFDLSPAMVQLMLSVNFLAYCACAIFAGMLGARFNRRHIILISLGVFIIGSVLCVTAQYYFVLLLGRFLQGIGIAAPSVLSYISIFDEYPMEKQASLLGILNGITTIAMAFAPTVGSHVNLYFNWRGNFFVLLVIGIICLGMAYFSFPTRPGNPTISLSLKSYSPVFKSTKLLTFIIVICGLVVPFWVFVGMSSILYIKNLGVSLEHFGYYQGAIAGVFSICSLLSPYFYKIFGQYRCLNTGIILCGFSSAFILIISLMRLNNPFIITLAMLVMAVGVAFPFNILFPFALKIIPEAKEKIAAIILAGRLILSSLSLELVGLIYDGTFLYIGLVMFFFLMISLIYIAKIYKNKWLTLNNGNLYGIT